MTAEEFWERVDQILAETRDSPDSTHTPEEELTAAGDFLVEIDLLASDWYGRKDIVKWKKS